MFSATPIAGYVNQLHIQNYMFKTNQWEEIKRLKMFFGGWIMVKNVSPAWSVNSKVDCLQNEQME